MATAEFLDSKSLPVRRSEGRHGARPASSERLLARLFRAAGRPVHRKSVTERAIEGHLRRETRWGSPGWPLHADTALLDAGILEPSNLECLVRFLEEEFDISIGDDQLVSGNFVCISSIAAMVDAIRANPPAPTVPVAQALTPWNRVSAQGFARGH